jgi:hypothetical protein
LFTQALAILGLAIGLAGIGWFVAIGSSDKLLFYNNLLAICALLVIATVVVVPKLSTKFPLFRIVFSLPAQLFSRSRPCI